MMPENLTLERAALRAEWQQKTIKEQIELRRQLRKSREAERDKNTLGLIKALEKRGTPTP